MEINVEHLAAERMMLDVLHQGEALGAGIAVDRQVNQEVFRNRVMEQVRELARDDFQVLRRGLATVNGRGHPAGGAEFFDFTAAHLRTLIGL